MTADGVSWSVERGAGIKQWSPLEIPRSALLMLLAVLATVAVAAGPVSAPGADPDGNLKLLRELKDSDPKQYARLVRNFERFRALPADQQEKLRRLDRELHEEDSATQARLMRVLGEYNAWLSRLNEADRQRVQAASSSAERLNIVRELKERQWFEHLPRARQEQWSAAPEAERKKLIEQWKLEERNRHEEWAEARRWAGPMVPMAQEGFRQELQQFVEKRLTPMLSPQEKARLAPRDSDPRRGAFGWVGWLRNVAELSDAHPVLALEPKYKSRKDLPEEYRKALDDPPPRPGATQQVAALPDGRWPDYPIAVARLLRTWGKEPTTQLGPASAKEISPAVEEFVRTKLTPTDRDKLKKVEGKWPDYPQALHELAREKKLQIPDLSPPGDPRMWEWVRTRPSPEPPEHLLREFALELNKKDPTGPRLSLADPADREIIKRRFFDANPGWRRRLEEQDKSKSERKGMRP